MTACIFSAVSFLESAINELFKDTWDVAEGHIHRSRYVETLDPAAARRLADVWSFTEAINRRPFSVLEKYEIALQITGQPQFNKGQNPYQNARLLIQLRNELVHYKSETLGGDDTHRLENSLQGRFPLNRLMDGSENPVYPDKCLGYGCCHWAADTSEAYADQFFQRIGIPPKYRAVDWPDSTMM